MERSRRAAFRDVVPEPFSTLDHGENDPGDKLTVRGPLRTLFLNDAVDCLRMEVDWKHEDLPCVNVVGVIPGVGLPEAPELADEVIKRGIVQTISPRHVDRLLKGGICVPTRRSTG